jgi:hypothetical protein
MPSLTQSPCALCGRVPTVQAEPPRRTLDRGLDPDDESYSITVILPDVPLCDQHAVDVREGVLRLGWCDDAKCRVYGEVDAPSPCGARYERLASGSRSRSVPKNH